MRKVERTLVPCTGGAGAGLFSRSGELVFFPSPRLKMTNCLFHDNKTAGSEGYAIYLSSVSFAGQPMLVNNTIANNPNGGIRWNEEGQPPGIGNSILWNNGPHEIVPDCASGAHVEFTQFEDDPFFGHMNSAFWGGGAIVNWGWDLITNARPVIDNCLFEKNHADGGGGGICNLNSPMELSSSTFGDNTAWWGGGVLNYQTIGGYGIDPPSIDACTFRFNRCENPDSGTGGLGAALMSFAGELVFYPTSEMWVTNSLFHDNTTDTYDGSAIYVVVAHDLPPAFVNCTIADNVKTDNDGNIVSGGGIRWEGYSPWVGNSILWNNGPHEIFPDCASGARVVSTDIMGGGGCDIWPGNIGWDPEDDPKFAPGGFSLQFNSPCIGAAEPSYAPEKDITGAYRDPLPDMGAYEYFPEDE